MGSSSASPASRALSVSMATSTRFKIQIERSSQPDRSSYVSRSPMRPRTSSARLRKSSKSSRARTRLASSVSARSARPTK
eukprot:3053594-Pyramimonas_sp.AAC.1